MMSDLFEEKKNGKAEVFDFTLEGNHLERIWFVLKHADITMIKKVIYKKIYCLKKELPKELLKSLKMDMKDCTGYGKEERGGW